MLFVAKLEADQLDPLFFQLYGIVCRYRHIHFLLLFFKNPLFPGKNEVLKPTGLPMRACLTNRHLFRNI
jgi:hypothetical protein